jgi:hypothetical protein
METTEVLLLSKGPADDWVKRIPQIRHRKTATKISSRFIRGVCSDMFFLLIFKYISVYHTIMRKKIQEK